MIGLTATPELPARGWVRTGNTETDLKQPSPTFLYQRSVSWETVFPWTGVEGNGFAMVPAGWFLQAPLAAQLVESAYNEGDLGSIPGLGRSPGEGKGHPLQYSCLETPMDRGV